ncbi:hypothetical protein M413DRAFT_439401 [Hebeloma cylindrosporum]|uniref:MOSC domain-containing protein n=1 Tax=Hebeloma cylindrosporum TaxID=76867 RepID=A0A0C3CG49_HEBCY|nr:hypothetical protein M413DRAFT_439401 [Hebeloma cylindrosporum h7]
MYTLAEDLMTWTSRLERLLMQFQESGNTFLLTTIVLSLSLGFVAHRIRNNQQKPTLSTSVPTSNHSSEMLSSTTAKAAPPTGSVIVSKILIHPIKSCRGISVQSAHYTPEGIENDRIWCIIDAQSLTVITAREVPKMVLIKPSIEPDGTLKICFPNDSGCKDFSIPLKPADATLKSWTNFPKIVMWPEHNPVDGYICESINEAKGTASATLSRYFEKPVHLVYKGSLPRKIAPTTSFPALDATAKYQDMYPMLVLSEESTGAIEKELQSHIGTQGIDERWRTDSVPIERFRPNIIFRGGGPFAEDDWEEIRIGSDNSPPITLVSKCTRCLLPNVNPETGERDKAVPYKVLMKFRIGLDPTHRMKPCVGCNAVPYGNGTVKVGDWVHIKKMMTI